MLRPSLTFNTTASASWNPIPAPRRLPCSPTMKRNSDRAANPALRSFLHRERPLHPRRPRVHRTKLEDAALNPSPFPSEPSTAASATRQGRTPTSRARGCCGCGLRVGRTSAEARSVSAERVPDDCRGRAILAFAHRDVMQCC